MVSTHDLTQPGYVGFPAKVNNKTNPIIRRKITGKLLKAAVLGTGAVPGNGDSYKIAKISKQQLVDYVWTIVNVADDTAITLSIGYTDGTNTSANAFEASAALNSAGVIASSDDQVLFDDDGYFLTITPSTLTAMDDGLEFLIVARVFDFSLEGLTDLTAPI